MGANPLSPSSETFHFGYALSSIVEENGFSQIAYFGGGSAPLMEVGLLEDIFYNVALSTHPLAVVNNYHSTDWMVLNQGDVLPQFQERLAKDNSLGWVLDHDAGLDVQAVDPCAASRVDIDTPSDLLMISRHPSLGSELKKFLVNAPSRCLDVIDRIREIMRTPASNLTLIGRTSPQIWGLINEYTKIWIRSFAEERGMMASGRFEREEVQSVLGEWVESWGPKRFIELLTDVSDGVIWDTRVWMAHRGKWPSTADRFASDLGWVDSITDSATNKLTQAVGQSEIPVLLGGHGVVSGGIYALLESLE
jgi:hypothetical protein